MPTGNSERRNKLFNLRIETPHEREATKKPIQVERLEWDQRLNNQTEGDDIEKVRARIRELQENQ